jgi:hypothetical protein
VLNPSWGAGHRAGHSGAGEDLDIAPLPVQTGAAIRHAQLFHPTGVLANGTIERIAATTDGLPMVPAEAGGPGLQGVGLQQRRDQTGNLAVTGEENLRAVESTETRCWTCLSPSGRVRIDSPAAV